MLTQTVAPNPNAPRIIGINPVSGPIAGGTPVSISGSGLGNAGHVNFGSVVVGAHCRGAGTGSAPCFTVRSGSEVVAYSPAVPGAAVVPLSVTDLSTGTSNSAPYSYATPAAVLPVAPGSGPPDPGLVVNQGQSTTVAPPGGTTGYLTPGPNPAGSGAPVVSSASVPVVNVAGAPGSVSSSAGTFAVLPVPGGGGVINPALVGLPEPEGGEAAAQEAHQMVRYTGAATSALFTLGGTVSAEAQTLAKSGSTTWLSLVCRGRRPAGSLPGCLHRGRSSPFAESCARHGGLMLWRQGQAGGAAPLPPREWASGWSCKTPHGARCRVRLRERGIAGKVGRPRIPFPV